MLNRFLLGCVLTTAAVVMGCSPNTEESAKVEGATDATPTATSGVNRPIQPAPDLDLADKGSVGAPTSGGSGNVGLGAFEVSFASDGFANACAVTKSAAPEFVDFVRLSPMASRIKIELRDGKLCIENLESGRDYEFQLLAGAPFELTAGQSVKTKAIMERTIAVRDLGTSLEFAQSGFVLAKGSSKGVPIFTTNISEVDLELVRVSERSLNKMIARMSDGLGSIDRWDLNQLLGESAVPVWKGKFSHTVAKNVRVERALPINEVIETLPEGLFLLVAADARDATAVLPSRLGNTPKLSSDVTAQWILSTNLGVSAAKFARGMTVSVRALDTAEPIRYARVDLITQSNDIVFSGDTDKDGVIRLPEPAVKGTRANAPSHLVVRSNRDFSFLVLDHAALDLSALDTQGRALKTKLDAYLFTDRGIYRPRETVHLTGLVRNQQATTKDIEAVSLVVLRPNGSVYKTLTPQLGKTASFAEPLTLPADAPRGSWRIEARSVSEGETVGAVEIDVQDFVPERLKVSVETSKGPAQLGASVSFEANAKFLYGAPGSGLGVEADAVVRGLQGKDLPDASARNFVFGDELQPFNGRSLTTSSESTDASGRTRVEAQTSSVGFPSISGFGEAVTPLEVSVAIGVQEPGGRTTKAQGRQIVLAGKPLIGLRSMQDGWVDTSASATFQVRQWLPDLNPTAVNQLQWQLQRVTWDWYYDRSASRWRYRQEIQSRVVAKGPVAVASNAASGGAALGEVKLPQLDWGRYALTVFDPSAGSYNRQTIYSGWSSNASASEPDFLEVKAQGKTFVPGSNVTVGVKAPFAGLARISVWTDREVFSQNVSVAQGDNRYELKTDSSWFPGAYVVVSAFRPTKSSQANVLSASRYMPVRAMGLIYLEANANRRLKVDLPEARASKPRGRESLRISVPQLAGKQGYAVVQAVDEGILQLTKFKTPSPDAHFFAKRALSADFYDDYGKLLRGDGAVGDIRTGSDQAQGSAGGQALPVVPTKSIVIYSGIVNLDADGSATVPIDLPDFNGSLRTMVSVWTDDSYGAAATDWVVRDPIVAELVLPRYIAPGDSTIATLMLANTTDSATEVKTQIATSGGLNLMSKASSTQTLKAGERKQLYVKVRAEDTGIGGIEVSVFANNGFAHKRAWEIYSRYAGQGVSLQGKTTTIQPQGNGSVSVGMQSLQRFGRTGVMHVSDEEKFSAAEALSDLISYPYTCSEQTVSKAGPAIRAYQIDPTYVEGIAKRVHRQTAKAWLQSNVDRIISRQSADGAIGLWRAGDDLVDPQLSTYLVDFLVTAELNGFELPVDSVATAYAWSYRLTEDSDLAANEKLYVWSELVKAISPHTKRAVRLARSLADRTSTADVLTISNLAVALRRFGDNARADALVERLGSLLDSPRLRTPGYYDSQASRKAKLAENLFALNHPKAIEIWNSAANEVSSYRYWWWSSVHEQGALLRAKVAQSTNSPLAIEVKGKRFESRLGSLSVPLDADTMFGAMASLNVRALTDRPLYAKLRVSAPPNPNASLEAVDGEFEIERQVFEFKTGREIASFRKAKVNERYVVLLTGNRTRGGDELQVMMKDPVPAGFQIESVISPSIRDESFDWLPELSYVDVTEITDDAFFAASLVDLDRRNSMRVAYVIRATTPGTYLATQAVMEDMYAPERTSSSNGVPVTVVP